MLSKDVKLNICILPQLLVTHDRQVPNGNDVMYVDESMHRFWLSHHIHLVLEVHSEQLVLLAHGGRHPPIVSREKYN